MKTLRFIAIAVLVAGCTDTSTDAPPKPRQTTSSKVERKTTTIQGDANVSTWA